MATSEEDKAVKKALSKAIWQKKTRCWRALCAKMKQSYFPMGKYTACYMHDRCPEFEHNSKREGNERNLGPVSYTHLDVYKRQLETRSKSGLEHNMPIACGRQHVDRSKSDLEHNVPIAYGRQHVDRPKSYLEHNVPIAYGRQHMDRPKSDLEHNVPIAYGRQHVDRPKSDLKDNVPIVYGRQHVDRPKFRSGTQRADCIR